MLFKFLSKKKKIKLQEQSEQKFDMNNWMNLTKEERLEIDFNEKNLIMRKKKALLKSIRNNFPSSATLKPKHGFRHMRWPSGCRRACRN